MVVDKVVSHLGLAPMGSASHFSIFECTFDLKALVSFCMSAVFCGIVEKNYFEWCATLNEKLLVESEVSAYSIYCIRSNTHLLLTH